MQTIWIMATAEQVEATQRTQDAINAELERQFPEPVPVLRPLTEEEQQESDRLNNQLRQWIAQQI